MKYHIDGAEQNCAEVVLFPFDSYGIPFRCGLQLNMVEAKLDNQIGIPVLRSGEPGAPDCTILHYYGSVIKVENEFRMWYLGVGVDHRFRVCFASSPDGIQWTKPELGFAEYNGNKKNNLVALKCDGDVVSCIVLYEPDESDPDRRFKMNYEHHGKKKKQGMGSMSVAYSRDGLVWKTSPNNPVIRSRLQQSGLIKYNGCYYVNGHGGGYEKRTLITYASYDFEHWTEAHALGLRRDKTRPRSTVYGHNTGEQVHLGASLWNRGNVIIGLYGMWHGSEDDDRRFVRMDLGMVVSHDALHYDEPIPDFRMIPARELNCGGSPRFPFYSKYTTEQPAIMQGQGFENVEDKTYFWYSAWHDGNVCLATWARDRFGFFSVNHPDAESMEGPSPVRGVDPHFISRPIRINRKGAKMHVNVDGVSEHSFLTVEVLDRQFREIPGYTKKNCHSMKEPGFRQPVEWEDKQVVESNTDAIRIKVNYHGLRVEDSHVYAVYLSE